MNRNGVEESIVPNEGDERAEHLRVRTRAAERSRGRELETRPLKLTATVDGNARVDVS